MASGTRLDSSTEADEMILGPFAAHTARFDVDELVDTIQAAHGGESIVVVAPFGNGAGTAAHIGSPLKANGYSLLVAEWNTEDFVALRVFEPSSAATTVRTPGPAPITHGSILGVQGFELMSELKAAARAQGVNIAPRPPQDVRTQPIAPARPARATNYYPDGFADSPSAIPVIAGTAQRAAIGSGESRPEQREPRGKVALVRREVARLLKFYRAVTGLLLLVALGMIGVGLIGFPFSWVIGLLGLVALGVFLPYRLDRLHQRQLEEGVTIRHRVNMARTAADTARIVARDVHQELRDSVAQLNIRIDRMEQADHGAALPDAPDSPDADPPGGWA